MRFNSVSILLFYLFFVQAQDPLEFNHLTILNGLSNNTVLCIYQDDQGFMWFGTRDGLNRYDGYEFKIFRSDPNDPQSLTGNHIQSIYEDNYQNLWVNSEVNSLDVLNKTDNKFYSIQNFLNDSSIEIKGIVRSMYHDSCDNLWIGASDELIMYNYKQRSIINFDVDEDSIDTKKLANRGIFKIISDANNQLWIGTFKGLSRFNYNDTTFTHFLVENHADQGLTDDYILDITLSENGNLILSTNSAGLLEFDIESYDVNTLALNNIINPQKAIIDSTLFWISTDYGLFTYNIDDNTIQHHIHDEKNTSSLSSNNVLDIFKDRAGTIWISHWHDGVSYFNECENKFHHVKKESCNNSINNNTVRCIKKDTEGDFWFGTDQGGINIFNSKTRQFDWFTSTRYNWLPSNVIKSLIADHDGLSFVGTSKGLVVLKKQNISGRIVIREYTEAYFKAVRNKTRLDRLLNSNIEYLYFDTDGHLWIGTTSNLFIFGDGNLLMTKITPSQYNPVYKILEDFEGNYWIGCLDGLYSFNKKTKRFRQINNLYIPSQIRVRINTLMEDSDTNMWIGTNGQGLYILDKNRDLIFSDTVVGLFPSKVINAMIEYNDFVWITTNKGIVKLNRHTFKTDNLYNNLDGLQSDQYYRNSAYLDDDGTIFFGGVNGYNYFHPEKIVLNSYKPPIVITSLKINNEEIVPGHPLFGSVIKQSIELADTLILNHRHNIVSIEFRSLNFLTPHKNQFAYFLEGFDNENELWNNLGNETSLSYTNLEPGEYNLMLRTANNDRLWNDQIKSLYIRVLPPWWKTVAFKIFTILFALFIIYLLKRWITYNLNLRNAIKVQTLEKDKQHEIEEMKLRFFTNISHEFRTPLTLILSPLEKILQNKGMPDQDRIQLSMMKNNAERLLRLVNQIMDFRKLEAGKLKLEAKYGDLTAFVHNIVKTFEQLAADKKIQLTFSSISQQVFTFFDGDKIDKIVFNLLSNAFKYTPERGRIDVSISLISKDIVFDHRNEKWIEISVEDNGRGIPADQVDKIFERFYQFEESSVNNVGTGIGLSLTKDLVELHNGTIQVISHMQDEASKKTGTRFVIQIPLISRVEDIHHPENTSQSAEMAEAPESNALDDADAEKREIILVVEDNQDMRLFIRSNLESEFKIIEASDGNFGKEKAIEHIPDLILADVMMPMVDGIEMVKYLKNDPRTSHIPVIFLTARASEEFRLEGLATGADDYITKPFSIDLLKQRIINILNSRKKLQQKYSREIILEPTNKRVESHDERFLAKAIEIVEQFMDDPEFNVDIFSREVGISRMQLYRKMNALTNQTAKEFIKVIRLKRAAQLLKQDAINVSEVAYSVGFRDLSYFRKCFKKQYGIAPSEFGREAT